LTDISSLDLVLGHELERRRDGQRKTRLKRQTAWTMQLTTTPFVTLKTDTVKTIMWSGDADRAFRDHEPDFETKAGHK